MNARPAITAQTTARLEEGEALQRAGKFQEARAIYQEVARAEPENPVPFYLTAALAQQIGNDTIGENMLRHALVLRPDFLPARIALLELLERQKRLDEAAREYEIAMELHPDDTQIQHSYGKLLFDTNRFAEAENVFRTILRTDKGLSGSWHMLGSALYTLGNMEEARHAFEETLRLTPESGMTHRHLSNIITYREGHPHLAQMEAIEKRTDIFPEHRVELLYGLGKAYHDLKRYDRAFFYYEQGASLRRKSTPCDIESDRQEFAETKAKFTALLPRVDLSAGCPDPTPIFILGMPRSGTTLVEQILSSHQDVAGMGEVPFLFDTLKRAGKTIGDRTVFNLFTLTPEQRRELGEHYIHMLRARCPAPVRHLIDKMPGNFRIVGFIAMILPNARIIHCTRGPMDTCLSIFRTHFTQSQPFGLDLRELGQYYRLYRELMEFWDSVLPGRIYNLNYETLVDDFEPQVRRLLDHCGLEWNEKCLTFHKTERSVATASATQVRTPLYRSSLQGWKAYAPYLTPLKEALGPYFKE